MTISEQGRPAERRLLLFVDADACPVKDEAYRVAARYGVHTYVVANQPIMVPRDPAIERVLVPSGLDEADDWIASHAAPGSVVITADVPLADRCVKAGAEVISPTGRRFTASSIGADLALRNLLSDLREQGELTRGPKPFSRKQRSEFLQALDRAMMAQRRLGFS